MDEKRSTPAINYKLEAKIAAENAIAAASNLKEKETFARGAHWMNKMLNAPSDFERLQQFKRGVLNRELTTAEAEFLAGQFNLQRVVQ